MGQEQVTISVGTVDQDFIRNIVRVLAELWAGFGVIRPSAFCPVTVQVERLDAHRTDEWQESSVRFISATRTAPSGFRASGRVRASRPEVVTTRRISNLNRPPTSYSRSTRNLSEPRAHNSMSSGQRDGRVSGGC